MKRLLARRIPGAMLALAGLAVTGIGAAGAGLPGEVTVGGDLVAGFRGYPESAVVGENVELDLGGEAEVRWRISRSWGARLDPRVWWDPVDPGRWRWVPRRFWVGYRTGGLDIRAGRQVITWGSADTWQPTGVVATRDWGRDFLDPEEQGDWTLTLAYGSDQIGFEIVYLPVLEGTSFPSARSPWSLQSVTDRLGLPSIPLVEDPLTDPDVSEHSLAFRGRLTTGQTDLYLVGFWGLDRQAVLTLDRGCEEPCLGLPQAARATYPALRLVGLEVQSAVRGVLLKLEATYRDQSSEDPDFSQRINFLAGHSVQVVAGIDYLWMEPFATGGDLDLVVEFLYDDATGGERLFAFRPFQRDLAGAIAYFFNDFHGSALELGWIQDLEKAESLGTLRFRRRIHQNLTAEIGGDLILAPPDDLSSPFNIFSANDRLVVNFSYGF